MSFFTIDEKEVNKYKTSVFPKFSITPSSDFMTQGHSFYAIWNEETGLWSKNEFDVARIIDESIKDYIDKHGNEKLEPLFMTDFNSSSWSKYKKFLKEVPDNYKQLDTKIVFANTEVKKSDYISRRLPYSIGEGSIECYEEIMSTLYDPEQREKIEWAIGSIIFGDSKKIQKFIGLYGGPGTGKSTVLNIIEALFEGYCVSFDAKELVSGTNTFAGDAFATNPLVAIQHDGDLSRVNDNSLLNTIVSHEKMTINEKFKSKFEVKLNTFLFMATNEPFKITNLNSGLSRRLIDVHPSGRLIDTSRYYMLMDKLMAEELGHIAYHCLEVYKQRGKSYYSSYKPIDMMFRTDPFFNFVQDYIMMSPEIVSNDCISLASAFDIYLKYTKDEEITHKMRRYQLRDALRDYFQKFILGQHRNENGEKVCSVFYGFKHELFDINIVKPQKKDIETYSWLNLKEQESNLDKYCIDWISQYAVKDNDRWRPQYKWENVKTKLSNIDTSKCHYIIPPEGNMIVIDFDIGNETDNRDIDKIMERAKEFPPTYAELSNGGGLHLHYIYNGDPNKLAPKFDEKIEVKIYTSDKKSGIRRRLSKCNNLQVAIMEPGFLAYKENNNKKMYNEVIATTEKGIRTTIQGCIDKQYQAGTKPNVDYIKKILDDAYNEGVIFDVTDMRPAIMAFAANSTHWSEYCLELVNEMHFCSDGDIEDIRNDEAPIAFYDVEVFPNLFICNYKFQGKDKPVIRMINPTPEEIKTIMGYRLVGFYNRKYDNHILYARSHGYSNAELFNLSVRLVNDDKSAYFKNAWNVSYTDVYDYAAKKQSLKKWEIELKIHHQELGLPWDQPVPKKLWNKVAEYCDNDVIATEDVWDETQGDFLAREILADLTDLTVNSTTNTLSTRFIFGDNKIPQEEFNYRFMGDVEPGHTCKMDEDGITYWQDDGKPIFKGYKYNFGKSLYLDVDDVGEGGYVFARPGMYENVWTFDVASMHPSSVIAENLFGDYYTKRFADILQLRLYIKHKEFDKAKEMFDGALAKYLDDPKKAKALAQALKIVINSVYGLTAASFENAFRDLRNVDNIVAKRGALFMINLKTLVERMGYTVVHIKTDSIKVQNPDDKVVKFINEYGKKFGYNFEIEHKFEKICLVNDAVYVAKLAEDDEEWLEDTSKTRWTATGTQFAVPYVFKTLFSHESIEFDDFCETKSVGKGELYLDMNEDLPDVEFYETCKETRDKVNRGVKNITKKALSMLDEITDLSDEQLDAEIAKGHNYQYIGRVSSFVPMKPGTGGGNLYRFVDGKYYTATGAKGYRWQEAEVIKQLHKEDCVDESYHQKLADEAVESISQYGDFEWFVS